MFGLFTAVFGYLYPAYETYKTVEKRVPDIDAFQFWGKYWVVFAILTTLETVLFILPWIPFYSLIKLAFLVYLWHPRTKGVLFFYHRFVQPFLAPYEAEIDRNLNELQTRGRDLAVEYTRKGAQTLATGIRQGIALAPVVLQKAQNFAAKSPPSSDKKSDDYASPLEKKSDDLVGGDYAVVDNPTSTGELRARTSVTQD